MATAITGSGDQPSEFRCSKCEVKFDYSEELEVHSKTCPECMTQAGRCFYYDYCSFSTSSRKKLANHMKEESGTHLEAITLTLNSLRFTLNQTEIPGTTEAQELISAKLKLLQSIANETSVVGADVSAKYKDFVAKNLEAERILTKVEDNASNLGKIQQQLKDQAKAYELTTKTFESDAGGLTLQKTVENIAADIEKLSEFYEQNVPEQFYDGVLRWNLNADEGVLVESPPFYTSKFGYKFGATAVIADGKLLINVFQKVGEFDALLKFPYTEEFAVRCKNRKRMTFADHVFRTSDDSEDFCRPVDDRNKGAYVEVNLEQIGLRKNAPTGTADEKPKADFTIYIQIFLQQEKLSGENL